MKFSAMSFALVLLIAASALAQQVQKITVEGEWQMRKAGNTEWLPAQVPGTVHTDLVTNGEIENPFYRDNESRLQWIEYEDWIYHGEFELDAATVLSENLDLVFHGLDTYADVYLNGKLLLESDNMFRTWRVDATHLLKEGTNKMQIYFQSPINKARAMFDTNPFEYPVTNDHAEKRVSPHVRKAQYHFGWDWGPRLLTSGVYRPIVIEAWDDARIDNIYIKQRAITEEKAVLQTIYEIHADTRVTATIAIDGNDESVQRNETLIDLVPGVNEVILETEIVDPELWWPNGLGGQRLYTITGSVEVDGEVVSTLSERIGLRTIELVNEIDEWGESFYFTVNDVPVFAKGANYIPLDSFLPRVDSSWYDYILQSAADANYNMVRVWGGGIYEEDIFYDLCDEKGLLVWQDFMFACKMYPADDDMLKSIALEAKDNIIRIRNHASLALWCGNNEIDGGWQYWGWMGKFNLSKEDSTHLWNEYLKIFATTLPDAVNQYDPETPYWEVSPGARSSRKGEFNLGDTHNWNVWHGKRPFESFETDISRFFSEYGFQSFPMPKSVEKYAIPEDYDIESEVMQVHQKSPSGNRLIYTYLVEDYREPKDFLSFLYVSQVLQGTGIKTAIEIQRRLMPYCMGSLYWQLNDCWPVASWSSIDYYGEWKALHYYCQTAYAQTLVSPFFKNDTLTVHIVNDNVEEKPGKLHMRVLDFDGSLIKEESKDVVIPSVASELVFKTTADEFIPGADLSRVVLDVTLTSEGETVSTNKLYFREVKDLDLPEAEVDIAFGEEDGKVTVTVSSDKLVKNLYLGSGQIEGRYSDNFFDVLPNEPVTVTFLGDTTVEELKKVIDTISIRDTY